MIETSGGEAIVVGANLGKVSKELAPWRSCAGTGPPWSCCGAVRPGGPVPHSACRLAHPPTLNTSFSSATAPQREEIEALVKATTDKWGSLDVLVNNAVSGGADRAADALLLCLPPLVPRREPAAGLYLTAMLLSSSPSSTSSRASRATRS